MGSVCASGGYYIAMAGKKIFAEPGTLTGSIGVVVALVILVLTYGSLVAAGMNLLTALLETNRLYRSGVLIQSDATVSSAMAQYKVGKVPFAAVLEAYEGLSGRRLKSP